MSDLMAHGEEVVVGWMVLRGRWWLWEGVKGSVRRMRGEMRRMGGGEKRWRGGCGR